MVARTYLGRYRPERLGRVVMLAPPNQGSEVADALRDWRAYQWFYGPGQELTTARFGLAKLPPVDFSLGIIAGTRTINPMLSVLLPTPNDGKVSVSATRAEGMTDHLAIEVSHPFLPAHPVAIGHVLRFIEAGAFAR